MIIHSLLLVAGLCPLTPAASQTWRNAVVITFSTPAARIIRAGKTVPAPVGTRIRQGDGLRTGAGTVELQTTRGAPVFLGANSGVRFAYRKRVLHIRLLRGRVLVRDDLGGVVLDTRSGPAFARGVSRGATYSLTRQNAMPLVRVFAGTLQWNSRATREAFYIKAGSEATFSREFTFARKTFPLTRALANLPRTMISIDDTLIRQAIENDGDDPETVRKIQTAREERTAAAIERIREEAEKLGLQSETDLKDEYGPLSVLRMRDGTIRTGAILARIGDRLLIHTAERVELVERGAVEKIESEQRP